MPNRWNTYVQFLFFSLALSVFPKGIQADSGQPIGFELFSWKAGGEWNFAVFEGTATHKSADTIRGRKNRLKNLSYLKGRLASLPSKEVLYWRQDPARDFVLPPKEIIQQVKEYAEGLQLDIELPEQPLPPARGVERQFERLETR